MKTIDRLGIVYKKTFESLRKKEENEASGLVNYLLELALEEAQKGNDRVIIDLAGTGFELSHRCIASRVLSRDHGLRARVEGNTIIMWGWSEV